MPTLMHRPGWPVPETVGVPISAVHHNSIAALSCCKQKGIYLHASALLWLLLKGMQANHMTTQ